MILPTRSDILPVHIVPCKMPSSQQMFCMDITSAKNYGKNIFNAEAYIKELENLLHTLSTPVK